jgi:hypothetical protein
MTIKTSLSGGEMVQRPTLHPAADPKALRAFFSWPPCHARHRGRLIANAQLEIDLTPTNEDLLKIPNRKWTRVLRAPWRIAISRSGFSRHAPRLSLIPSYLATHHSPLIIAFLIYCPAIRNPRKRLKT